MVDIHTGNTAKKKKKKSKKSRLVVTFSVYSFILTAPQIHVQKSKLRQIPIIRNRTKKKKKESSR